MSTREALVVPVVLEKHNDADSLSVVKVGGYTVVVRTEQWNGITKGIYIPPDEIVDITRPEFSFLEKPRIKAKKLRGIWSMGLLIPAPEDANVGDNYYDSLGLVHYEPELNLCTGGECTRAPTNYAHISKYDIENARGKYSKIFVPNEDVFVQVKIHGANTSVVYTDGQLYVHSRTQWPKENDSNVFWKAVNNCPELVNAARNNPGLLIYGETYGMNPGFHYDASKSNPKFRCFDVLRPDGTFFNVSELTEFVEKYKIPFAPVVGIFPFDLDAMCKLSESCSFNKGVDEGIVFRSLTERQHPRFGRAIGKIINPAYLEKN